ncbi:hypothetical protein MSAN_00881100 [Mycena sanguinolenta]|uniref:Uncharacterized protein n=1 Tax=Mycena sanguinolenta TaxID=230812 RepID=A0A8H6YZP1_9AGAR|nr:hypothetical protein MSAN_00881100 [Mycena sanguinolenta]
MLIFSHFLPQSGISRLFRRRFRVRRPRIEGTDASRASTPAFPTHAAGDAEPTDVIDTRASLFLLAELSSCQTALCSLLPPPTLVSTQDGEPLRPLSTPRTSVPLPLSGCLPVPPSFSTPLLRATALFDFAAPFCVRVTRLTPVVAVSDAAPLPLPPLAGHRPFDDATPPVNRGCAVRVPTRGVWLEQTPRFFLSFFRTITIHTPSPRFWMSPPATQTRQRGVRRPVDSPRCYCRRRAYATPAVLDAGWTFSSLLRVTVPAERIFAASTPSWVHATQPPRFSTPPHPPASSPPDSRPSSLFPTPRHSAPPPRYPRAPPGLSTPPRPSARTTVVFDAAAPSSVRATRLTHARRHRFRHRATPLPHLRATTLSTTSTPFRACRRALRCRDAFRRRCAFRRCRTLSRPCYPTHARRRRFQRRATPLPHLRATVLSMTPRLSRATVLFDASTPLRACRRGLRCRDAFRRRCAFSTLPHISATLGLSRVPPPFSPPPCPTARATACFDAATPLCLCPALFDAAAPLHPPTTPPPTPPPTPQPQPPPPTDAAPTDDAATDDAATDDAATDDATPFVDGAQWSINARRHQFICVCGGGRT